MLYITPLLRKYLLFFFLFSLGVFSIAAYLDQQTVNLYKQQQIDVIESATQSLDASQLKQLIKQARIDHEINQIEYQQMVQLWHQRIDQQRHLTENSLSQ